MRYAQPSDVFWRLIWTLGFLVRAIQRISCGDKLTEVTVFLWNEVLKYITIFAEHPVWSGIEIHHDPYHHHLRDCVIRRFRRLDHQRGQLSSAGRTEPARSAQLER